MMVFIRPTGAPLGVGATLGFAPNGSAASLDTAAVNPGLASGDYVLAQSGGRLVKVAQQTAAGGIVNVLAFGADPAAGADSAPAFNAAITSVPSGSAVRIFVPRGSYRLDSVINQQGRVVAVEFDDGADIADGSAGYLGVARVEARYGGATLVATNTGYSGGMAAQAQSSAMAWELTENAHAVQNGWALTYTDQDTYKTAGNAQVQLFQRIVTALGLFDTPVWGEWGVVNGPLYDEFSRDMLGVNGSAQWGEFDIANNAPELGWTDVDALGTPAAGLAVDPSGGNTPQMGGHIRYAFGTAGGVTGGNTAAGALNNRWWTYPALFSAINPAASGAGAQISITATDGAGTVHGPVTVTVGGAGALSDWATAINAAAIPGVGAAVNTRGGTLSRLVIFSTVAANLGTLTLGGTGLAGLGYAAGSYFTPRAQYVTVFGAPYIPGGFFVGGFSFAAAAPAPSFTINGHTITVGGAGAPADVAAAINAAAIPGIVGAVNRAGALVVAAWCGSQTLTPPYWSGQVMGSLTIAGAGATTVGLPTGTFWAPTPPLAFATAWSDANAGPVDPGTIEINGVQIPVSGTLVQVAAAIVGANVPAVTAFTRANGAQLAIRQTGGAPLTLQDTAGRVLDNLGIAAAGASVTYQPGGYSAGSFNAFFAAPDSLAPGGRAFYAGGASSSDQSGMPHAPLEARHNFRHGLRLDQASLADNVALRMASGQALAWGSPGSDHTLTVSAGTLELDGAPVGGSGTPGAGTVTSVVAGPGLGGGTITGSGTLSADWTAGTVAALGPSLSIASGTLDVAIPVQQWTAGAVSAVGGALTLSAGTLSAAAAPAQEWTAGTVTAVGGIVTLNAGTLEVPAPPAQEWTAGTVTALGAGLALAGGTLSLGADFALEKYVLSVPGTLAPSTQYWTVPIVEPVVLPAGWASPSSAAAASTPAATTATTVAVSYVRAGTTTAIGSVTFGAGASTGALSGPPSAVTLEPGDLLIASTGTAVDASLANLGFTMVGTRL